MSCHSMPFILDIIFVIVDNTLTIPRHQKACLDQAHILEYVIYDMPLVRNYEPFAIRLHEMLANEAEFSFSKIERILGYNLGTTAHKWPAWWSNSPTHPLMKQVLKVGWETTKIDLRNKIVAFHRTGYPALVKSRKSNTKKRRKKRSVPTTETILKQEKKFRTHRNNQLKKHTPDFMTS